ncbi:hypothetical protein CHUAL_008753 [Chamberlinius hualienensis]
MSFSNKFKEFTIVLDNPSATYFPGQEVTGHVKIHSLKTIKTTGIFVRFLGSCYASNNKTAVKHHGDPSHFKRHYDHISKRENRDNWTGQSSYVYQSSDNEQRKYYKDTEIYFDMKQQLWGTDKPEKFDAGDFNLAFQFKLPSNLPTSYEGEKGYVRYVAMASVTRSWNSNYRTTKPFTIVSIVDLNNIPGVDKPVSKHESRKFGFFIFKAGSVTTKAGVNKKGFVPGETITLNGEIFNGSLGRINKTVTHLVCVTTYKTGGHVSQSKQDLAQVESVSIPSKCSWELKNIQLKIPPSPPSGLGGCGLITVDYHVEVTSVTDMGCVELCLPIIIGTIPLKVDFATMQAPARTPSRRAPPRPPPPSFPQLLPSASAPPIPPEIQEAAKKRLAKEQEALTSYRGDSGNVSTSDDFGVEEGSAPSNMDLLTGSVAVVDISQHNTEPWVDINQISSDAASEMYPDLPPPTYEECVYGERVTIGDSEVDNLFLDGSNEATGGDIRTAAALDETKKKRNTFAPSYVYYHQSNGEIP